MSEHVDTTSGGSALAELEQAIDANDLARVRSLMTDQPALHRAPLGYGEDGPLTWVAECRVPRQPPGPARLAIARWMIEHGSDVHQGGGGPLMRAALDGSRVPMMELLVSHGADVNALWHGFFPILFAPCEGAWRLRAARRGRGVHGAGLRAAVRRSRRSPDRRAAEGARSCRVAAGPDSSRS